ncbi:hypothetical protein HPP92_027499 [Vanilla planifolia]|uniref:Uncharacterized protein n=1 Tax=Vanilla planifolia TaxID=51239 RepID=A0A835U5G1_VANPL|nr:hypothetical protein HPP92_027499 [Vanilla planifolia]
MVGFHVALISTRHFLLYTTWKRLKLSHSIRIPRKSSMIYSSNCMIIFMQLQETLCMQISYPLTQIISMLFEQLCTIKNNAGSLSQFVKKMATSLPYTCQSQSPSPYFDLSLFRYDEKLISATDRLRHSTEHPIKFISRRQPHILKFKIKPGPETSGSDARQESIIVLVSSLLTARDLHPANIFHATNCCKHTFQEMIQKPFLSLVEKDDALLCCI